MAKKKLLVGCWIPLLILGLLLFESCGEKGGTIVAKNSSNNGISVSVYKENSRKGTFSVPANGEKQLKVDEDGTYTIKFGSFGEHEDSIYIYGGNTINITVYY